MFLKVERPLFATVGRGLPYGGSKLPLKLPFIPKNKDTEEEIIAFLKAFILSISLVLSSDITSISMCKYITY